MTEADKKKDFPIVTLCGNSKSLVDYEKMYRKLTMEGKIVLLAVSYSDSISERDTKPLTRMQQRMIEMADEVCLISELSTMVPVADYAIKSGKHITFAGQAGVPDTQAQPFDDGLVYDHLGNSFASEHKMCDHWNIPYSVYKQRRLHNWPLRDRLERPIRRNSKSSSSVKVDHEGKEYESEKDMCDHYGIKIATFRTRYYDYKWDLKRALTEPPTYGDTVKDHEGREFPSVREMCRYWNISASTFKSRKKRGLLLKECLTDSYKVKDHTGREFDSVSDMSLFWGVKPSTFRARFDKGLPLEDCLKADLPRGKRVTDHTGREFGSIQEMSYAWGLSPATVTSRMQAGRSMEECLTKGKLPPLKKKVAGPEIK